MLSIIPDFAKCYMNSCVYAMVVILGLKAHSCWTQVSGTDGVFNRDGSFSHSACIKENVLMEEVKLQISKVT